MRQLWNPGEMEVGLPELDRAHREVINLLSSVVTAVESGYLAAAGSAVAELEEQAGRHFAEEEMLFPAARSHDAAHHRQAHAEAIAAVAALRAVVEGGDAKAALIALGRLVPGILSNVLQDDVALAIGLAKGGTA